MRWIQIFHILVLVLLSPLSFSQQEKPAKPCSGDRGGPHSNVNSSSPVFPNLRTEACRTDSQEIDSQTETQ